MIITMIINQNFPVREHHMRYMLGGDISIAQTEVMNINRITGQLPPDGWIPPQPNKSLKLEIKYLRLLEDIYVIYCPEAMEGQVTIEEIIKKAINGEIKPDRYPLFHNSVFVGKKLDH